MTDDTTYRDDFYRNRHQQTLYAAQRLLELVADTLPPIHSAVDVGCGVGTWLAVLKAEGVERVEGYDGPWVNETLLEIPPSCFTSCDLTQVIGAPSQKFDLALSLEVAEHLPESSASSFITTLTNQSDFVLFSAAIPHQGGRHHVNEQWLEYWIALFIEKGYAGLDILRRQLWHDNRIQPWYRQNAVLFVARHRLEELNLKQDYAQLEPVSLVHPRSFEDRIARYETEMARMQSLKGSWKLFRRAARKRIGHKRS